MALTSLRNVLTLQIVPHFGRVEGDAMNRFGARIPLEPSNEWEFKDTRPHSDETARRDEEELYTAYERERLVFSGPVALRSCQRYSPRNPSRCLRLLPCSLPVKRVFGVQRLYRAAVALRR
jgi:hypothetical protein